MRLLVTRPEPQADVWVRRLQAAGFDARALPLLRIAGMPDPAPLHQAWRALSGVDLAMFVSPNAVLHFFAARPHDVVWPDALPAAAPGPGTAQELRGAAVARVIEPPSDAPQFDSEALWQVLARQDWAGRRTLIVRGDGGRDVLAQRLRGAGAAVQFVQAYRRAPPEPDDAQRALLRDALARPRQHLWLFSSSEAIDHLAALVPGADWSCAAALASHPRIAERARVLGCADVHETAPTFDAVTAAARAWRATTP